MDFPIKNGDFPLLFWHNQRVMSLSLEVLSRFQDTSLPVFVSGPFADDTALGRSRRCLVEVRIEGWVVFVRGCADRWCVKMLWICYKDAKKEASLYFLDVEEFAFELKRWLFTTRWYLANIGLITRHLTTYNHHKVYKHPENIHKP